MKFFPRGFSWITFPGSEKRIGIAYRGFSIQWFEEWSQFFKGPRNWYTFHPIQVMIEDERNMGRVVMLVIILGFGFEVSWNYRETEKVTTIIRQAEELIDRQEQ
ncbi:hypothetical protein [Mesorhizobium sp.]|uniref:hypothetical protein n=1 Tax=Mesorhizobium sp. TaxID=1871066 RepID=UPI000FE3F412|nr:hypothetical protein [Mesorhizobium sp.]RWK28719.1 MAG: hypothetical protein EOR40_28265 [Mesorhizobium sp.]RWK91032.1 MAG: hypothetical protein EOR52_05740 [Mesorhizobium sp.]TIP17945.1 MAG: hypothetical protein E5X66_19030 [Mesorhizobium sp.]TJV81346.1 MAG: hypothetical protein E5X45_16995 [Mesorhizobium sp.]TJW17221.1 MAG: hypothetical protein E5X42_16170 [Mesorhizobium sp.]